MIIGGGMANTFLAAQGYGIGKSLVEADKIDLAKELIAQAKEQGTKLLLPVDVMVAAEFKNDADHKVVSVDAVPADWMILDVGTKTQELFAKELASMKLIVWNGPMGVFEMETTPKARKPLLKPLLIPTLFLSSAAVTPFRLSTRPVLPTRSATSRRAAVLPSNTSKANSSRASLL